MHGVRDMTESLEDLKRQFQQSMATDERLLEKVFAYMHAMGIDLRGDDVPKRVFVLSARDATNRIDSFPEDLEANLFSLSKSILNNLVAKIGKRAGGIFLSYLVGKKATTLKKNYFTLDPWDYLENPRRYYSKEIVEAVQLLCGDHGLPSDIVVIKCSPKSKPWSSNPDCPGCSEITQFPPPFINKTESTV